MRIYLDHNATSPLTPSHWHQLTERLGLHSPNGEIGSIGNPSSPHLEGRAAQGLLNHARRSVSKCLGVAPQDVIFTASATEANNTVINTFGMGHTVSSSIEHPSIREPLLATALKPQNRTWIHPNRDPFAFLLTFIDNLHEETTLVTFMSANNETGLQLPTRLFGDFLHEMRFGPFQESALERDSMDILCKHVPKTLDRSFFQNLHFHVDATQSFGKVKTTQWLSPGMDSFSLSSHKLGGLMGAGSLIVRRGRNVNALLRGGGQERVKRAGTENLTGITSLGLIAETIATEEFWSQIEVMKTLALKLEHALKTMPNLAVLSNVSNGLPNTVHALVLSEYFSAEDVLIGLDLEGIAASSGSACSSGANRPSQVIESYLRASELDFYNQIGQPNAARIAYLSKNGLRFSLCRETSEREIDQTISAIGKVMAVLANKSNHR